MKSKVKEQTIKEITIAATTITRKKVKVSEIEEIEERVEDKIYTKIAMWMRRI